MILRHIGLGCCSTSNIVHFENMSDQEAVDDIIDNVEENYSDVDVNDNEEKPLLPANISLIISKYCVYEDGDEPWEIRADGFSSDECDADLPTCSKLFQADNSKTQGTERKILVPNKKLKNSICVNLKTSSDKKLEKLKLKKESDLLQIAKKRKYSQGDDAGGMDVNSKFSQINLENNCEMDQIFVNKKPFEVNVKSGESTEKSRLNKNLDNRQDFSETNRILSDLPDSTSSKNQPEPSCSTDLAGPSNSMGKLHLVSDLPESNVDKKLLTKVLSNICNKLYSTDSCKPMTTPKENVEQNQDVTVIPIEKCHCLKGLSTNLKHSSGKGSDSQMKNSQCFVEDKDFVNPDILYNINLNEHYKQMDLLVQKIVRTTDDQTRLILDECMQLPPIPRIEHERKTFTAKERLNFLHGIPEWEYDIDGDDWNKIMVKRAVVFTAHAGFSIANEESLYVLADVAIDYIKKLAIILKRNFDIQSNSSYPDIVNPITNSLLEIGVNGGIDELIKHYENDVYGRRNMLIKKCQHLQKIVDQFVERASSPVEPKIKTQYAVKQEEGGTARDVRAEADATRTTTRTTTVEGGGVDSEPRSTADQSAFANVVAEHTEPVYVDSADNEADAKTVENDVGDGRTDGARTADARTTDFDLLKPLTGYVFHEPITCAAAADTGVVHRKRPNAWDTRNERAFDVRDYERPYNIQTLDRSRTSAAGRPSGSRRAANVEQCATTVVRSVWPAAADGRPPALRTALSDLEDRFRRFTWCRAHDDDVPSADYDDGTVVRGGRPQGRVPKRRSRTP